MKKFLSTFIIFLSLSLCAQTDTTATQQIRQQATTTVQQPTPAQKTVTAMQKAVITSQKSTSQTLQPAAEKQASIKPQFGFLSYDSVLHALPDYAVASRQIEELRVKYDAETKRVEDDFNKKYEEFLEGQREFPQTILQKRQSELQEMLDKNIRFKEESRRLLAAAEKDIFAPLRTRLDAELRAIGIERNYLFIINTDGNSCPFINPARGEDIGRLVLERLK